MRPSPENKPRALGHLLGLAALLWLPLCSLAQYNPLAGRDTLTLVRERIESLPPSAKPTFSIPQPDLSFDGQGLQFQPDSIAYAPRAGAFPVGYEAVPKPVWERLKNNYLMVGLGAYITPVFRAYVTNGRSTKTHWALQAEHFSSPNGHTDYANFSEQDVQASGRILRERYSLFGRAHFAYQQRNHFADTLVDRWKANENSVDQVALERQIRQRFFVIELEGGIENNKRDARLDYRAPLQLKNYTDRRGVREWHLGTQPYLNYRISDQWQLKLESTLQYAALEFNNLDTNRYQAVVQLSPILSYRQGPLRLAAGLGLGYASLTDSSSTRVYPQLQASYQLLPAISPYLVIAGGMRALDRSRMMADMPYLREDQWVRPYSEDINVKAGIQGHGLGLHYDLAATLRSLKGLPVYFGTTQAGVYFGQELAPGYFLYLSEKSFTAAGLEAQLGYTYKSWETQLRMQYQSYTLDRLPYYFQMPEWQAQLRTSYLWANKIRGTLLLNHYGSRTMGLSPEGNPIEADAYLDLNAAFDYAISQQFSVFCQFNNLLGSAYERWIGYRERPLDFRLGGTVSF